MKMKLDRIPAAFCEGPFWGNGRIGSVLYIRENRLCICLDQTGLWEMRETLPDEPRASFSEILDHKTEYLNSDSHFCADTNIFDTQIGRTKLPSLAVTFALPDKVHSFVAETDCKTATSKIAIGLENGGSLQGEIWIDSLVDVLLMRWKADFAWQMEAEPLGWDVDSPKLSVLKRWGYPRCAMTKETDGFTLVQPFSGDKAAVLSGTQKTDENGLTLALTIATDNKEQAATLAQQGKKRTENYLEAIDAYRAAHEADWANYWSGFGISIPNDRLQEAFEQEMYKLYCNEREFGAPVTLQGVWNPDNRMPAWFGDLHNDLNVAACYWAAFRTGNVKLVRPYVDAYAAAIPRLMKRAQKLFGTEDAIHLPIMMAPDGTGAASEWCFWNTVVGPELFAAADFTWFYAYTREEETLREKIYPFIKGVVRLYQAIAQTGEDGYLHIPFTMSPEMDLNGHMLLADDATFALVTLRDLCKKLDEYEAILGIAPHEWSKWSDRLVPVQTNEHGYPVYRGIELTHSHRHFSHLFACFPLNLDAHSETANRSLDHVINQGLLEYASWSFPYLAILASRCGRGNMCRTMLELYCMCFRSRNSFTVNGDPYQNGVIAVSDSSAGESADSFTLEAGLIVPAALCEMFVHRIQDEIWVAAGLPDEWAKCSCHGLAIEGGHRIDVSYDRYQLQCVRLTAGCSETVTICWKSIEKQHRVYVKTGNQTEMQTKMQTKIQTSVCTNGVESICLDVTKGETYELRFELAYEHKYEPKSSGQKQEV